MCIEQEQVVFCLIGHLLEGNFGKKLQFLFPEKTKIHNSYVGLIILFLKFELFLVQKAGYLAGYA